MAHAGFRHPGMQSELFGDLPEMALKGLKTCKNVGEPAAWAWPSWQARMEPIDA